MVTLERILMPKRHGIRTLIWGSCILAAFITSHTPPPAKLVHPLINDKLLHFLGFTLMGVLTVWRLGGDPRRLGIRILMFWYLGLVAYGTIDETTQPFFQRDCEFLDWAADCGGGAFGMTLGVLALRFPLLGS